MDHERSIETQAVEKYLLGELPPEEREAFERHFFECEWCAEEVRLGYEFKDAATAVLLEAPLRARMSQQPKRRDWFAWLRLHSMVPAAACLCMATLAGYQGLVRIPALQGRVLELNQPHAVQSTFVLPPSSRAAAPVVSLSAGPFFPLTLSIGAIRPAEGYECHLRSGSGKVISRIRIPRLEPETNLTLMIPTNSISAGPYEVVLLALSGRDSAELNHYRFLVRP